MIGGFATPTPDIVSPYNIASPASQWSPVEETANLFTFYVSGASA